MLIGKSTSYNKAATEEMICEMMAKAGGDEFVVFLQIPGKEWAAKKARELVKNLHKEVVTDAGSCLISTSIGIAIYLEMGDDFETLYRNADEALYRIK